MNINDAIDRLSNCNPITKEDKEIFECAVDCMNFTKDFLPLNASPERMKHALNLLNSLEFVFDTEVRNKSYINGATELANRLKKWVVESSNYWFSCSVNAEIDDILKEMINE